MTELTARVRNLGTETAFDVLARAAKLAQSGKDIVNLGIGQPFERPQAAPGFDIRNGLNIE